MLIHVATKSDRNPFSRRTLWSSFLLATSFLQCRRASYSALLRISAIIMSFSASSFDTFAVAWHWARLNTEQSTVPASDDFELFASNSIRVVSRGRHSGVGVGWPPKNRVGTSRRGIAQTYGRWEKKTSPKAVASGTRASSLELAKLVVVALLMLDCGYRWCNWRYNGAAVEDDGDTQILRHSTTTTHDQ